MVIMMDTRGVIDDWIDKEIDWLFIEEWIGELYALVGYINAWMYIVSYFKSQLWQISQNGYKYAVS